MKTLEILICCFFALIFVKISIQLEFILIRLKFIDKHIGGRNPKNGKKEIPKEDSGPSAQQ